MNHTTVCLTIRSQSLALVIALALYNGDNEIAKGPMSGDHYQTIEYTTDVFTSLKTPSRVAFQRRTIFRVTENTHLTFD